MYDKLSDLRILEIALAIEETYEDYQESLLGAIEDSETRERLAPLFQESPTHKRLRDAHWRLRDAVEKADGIREEDALQVMLECERSARDLYLRYLDRVSDPRIVDLLRDLAHQEEEHERVVARAMGRIKH